TRRPRRGGPTRSRPSPPCGVSSSGIERSSRREPGRGRALQRRDRGPPPRGSGPGRHAPPGRAADRSARPRRARQSRHRALARRRARGLEQARARALRPRPRRLLVLGGAIVAAGTLLGLGLMLRAREEARHPEAVVVAPMLDVLPAPDERPVSPYLLAAGEEVRLGSARGDLVEVRVGGNTIGWARRSGLWRVDEAPRYTARSGSK